VTTVVTVLRIARETKKYKAEDMSGAGAADSGGRWNDVGTPMIYASMTRALAALETLVHLQQPEGESLPLDRYLIAIGIPVALWRARTKFDPKMAPAWDAIPDSASAIDWGTTWATSNTSVVATVPSVIAPEEKNVLINPQHPFTRSLKVTVARKWLYDPRLVTT
jgi:RES domain-containing protein